jgi:DNA polymerase III subunit gamma/tau
MAYQSLYRKYRPQNFHDVMGQGHVVRTLQNAIASGRVAHGYLFTGTRGTAKTTVARLLAKALNCQSADHPVMEPCNVCEACLSITNGGATDVIELDAASHRGVADIEEVRKQVGYGPMSLRYKVFIIDEAHQLSSDAKDAFLKTLEEPPANVVFILATTEPQAIPITIRSRCQQFDFKRGSLTEITSRLQYVLEAEGVGFTQEALTLIARGAEGSYRDSLSLLEQVLAFSERQIDAESVNMVLGSLDSVMLERVVGAIATGNAPEGFLLASELLDAGKEARTLLKTLTLHFRDLLLAYVGGPAVAAELTPEEVTRLQAQAKNFTPAQMTKAIDILTEAQQETRWNNQHRLLVEMAFLKLMTIMATGTGASANQPQPSQVVLQTAPIVFDNIPKPVPTPPVTTPVATTVVPTVVPQKITKEEEVLSPTFFAPEETDDEDDYVPEEEGGEGEEPIDEQPEQPSEIITNDISDINVIAEELDKPEPTSLFDDPLPEPPLPKAFEGPNLFEADDEAEDTTHIEAEEPVTMMVMAAESAMEPTDEALTEAEPMNALLADTEAPGYTIADINRAWPRFLAEAERISKRAAVMMNKAYPSSVEGNTIVITFNARANHDMMSQPKQIEFVRSLLAVCLGRGKKLVPVRFVLAPDASVDRKVERAIVRHDPRAQIDALAEADSPLNSPPPPAFAPPPPSGYEAVPRYTPPVSQMPQNPQDPQSVQKNETFRDKAATNPYNRDNPVGEPAPAPLQKQASNADKKAQEKIALALEDAFVQEILTVFGGEVLE